MGAEYHTASERAEALVGVVRTKIDSADPGVFKISKIHLKFKDGKWHLYAAAPGAPPKKPRAIFNPAAFLLGAPVVAAPDATFCEKPLWTQGYVSSEEFIGELEDARGTHLFSFKVDGDEVDLEFSTIVAGQDIDFRYVSAAPSAVHTNGCVLQTPNSIGIYSGR